MSDFEWKAWERLTDRAVWELERRLRPQRPGAEDVFDPIVTHAEYRHDPGEPGVFTVCGEDGSSDPDLDRVNCDACLRVVYKRLGGY